MHNKNNKAKISDVGQRMDHDIDRRDDLEDAYCVTFYPDGGMYLARVKTTPGKGGTQFWVRKDTPLREVAAYLGSGRVQPVGWVKA